MVSLLSPEDSMDWKTYLDTNPESNGDPVTAMYLPRGFVMAEGHDLAIAALGWALWLASEKDGEDPTTKTVRESAVNDLSALTKFAAMLNGLPLGKNNRVADILDGEFHFQVKRGKIAERNAARLVIRPHNQTRDHAESGPPTVLVEWSCPSPAPFADLRIRETFGPLVRKSSCAWTDPSETGLATVHFALREHGIVRVDGPGHVEGFEWDPSLGGTIEFGTPAERSYLVTLPHAFATPLVFRVMQSQPHLGGETNHLRSWPRRQPFQRF